ncbi:MAG: hypothetical protein PHV05_03125 [Candidatus Riflebacteria bacterium]|nr:hypothetical protein [Candidatus Riflebacteria bacterium]
MATKTDKRTSNLVIAAGYCLVAIVILFNYLGKADLKIHKQNGRSSMSADAGPASEALSRQLEEEKRVNLEMRDMIRRLQSILGEKGSKLEVAQASHESVVSADPFAIPVLDRQLLDNLTKPRSNPFIPGKNPFGVAQRAEAGVVAGVDFVPANALICDPRLPFIITGSNSKSGYFANF